MPTSASASGPSVSHKRPRASTKGAKGSPSGTALLAAPEDHGGPLGAGTLRELSEEAGLAEARLAGEEHARTLRAFVEGSLQRRQLGLPAHERGLPDPRGHAAQR